MTPAPRIDIAYESEGFVNGGLVTNGSDVLRTNWDELLWAAVTVGRPNRQYVFRHGLASRYEALFRWSLVRMALEQAGPRAYRLRRTTAAKALDPSEKGAINYFLGLAICELFADRLLGTPWMVHLDVFRPQLNPLLIGRSRPDLVGQSVTGQWVALECKGRVSKPSAQAKDKAKEQAERLISVNGTPPAFSIGGIVYFRGDVLEFFWRDPRTNPERVKKPIEVRVDPNAWRLYYQSLLDLFRSETRSFEAMISEPTLVSVEGLDPWVGIHPLVLQALNAERWDEARRIAERVTLGGNRGDYQVDGVRVAAGPTWLLPFKEDGAENT